MDEHPHVSDGRLLAMAELAECPEAWRGWLRTAAEQLRALADAVSDIADESPEAPGGRWDDEQLRERLRLAAAGKNPPEFR